MYWSGCPGDGAFGPAIHGCRDDFDFTLTFERIFFSLIPAAVFVAVSLARVAFLIRQREIVGGTILRMVKLFTTIVYGSLQFILLVLSARSGNYDVLYISSVAVVFVCSPCIIIISPLEHSRAPRPSILLAVYLFPTLLFDIAQTRTLWIISVVNSAEVTSSRLLTSATVVKGVLFLLESLPKSKWVRWNSKEHSPEETSGILGLASFAWLNQVFLAGFRKVLTLNDLLSLDQSMAAEVLQSQLIEQVGALKPKGQKYGLARALANTLAIPILLPISPRVAMIVFRFCQPFLINTLLDYLQRPAGDSSLNAKNNSYGLIGATILIYGGIAISTALYWYLHERMLCMCRGSLAGVIYKKTTEVGLSASSNSAALTLMSTDVERIRLGFLNLHEFWANTTEAVLASWLVERQLGTAYVAPVIVVLVCVACAAFANRYTGERQKAWMGKIQARVSLTANVISDMKHLKISGLTGPVEDMIQDMRVDELRAASRFRFVYVIVFSLGYAPLALSPVVAFAVTARTLDVSRIFTSVSYLLLLADPLGYLFQNTPNLISAFSCLDRIQAFLEEKNRIDFRQSRVDKPRLKSEKGQLKLDIPRPVISITNGSFGWESDTMVLKGISLNIPWSGLTMVVGPVGSGKSTLCKVLLGEVPIAQGQVILNSFLHPPGSDIVIKHRI